MQPTPPLVSPDGRFYLDEDRWVPLPAPAPSSRTVARGVAHGVSTVIAQLVVAFVGFPVALLASMGAASVLLPSPASYVLAAVLAAALSVGLFVLLRRWR